VIADDTEAAVDGRFAFGENWIRFLSVLDDDRIRCAEQSLTGMLGPDALRGKTFLDIGSGSGLFSLAAVRLGAARVHSFDLDRQSVNASCELKRRYAPKSTGWTIDCASILDTAYVARLGQWDIVYSWGVLHHTGAMEQALSQAAVTVAPGGQLFIAIYNDQGWKSRAWRRLKRMCVAMPGPVQPSFAILAYLPFELRGLLGSLLRLKPQQYVRRWTGYGASRGMSHWHDVLDWVGGFPFEVAKPEAVFDFYQQRGFVLTKLRTNGGLGCNEFVFTRNPLPAVPRPAGQAAHPSAPATTSEPPRNEWIDDLGAMRRIPLNR